MADWFSDKLVGHFKIMKYRLEISFIGDLPKGLNGSHGHWAVKAKERKKWREIVFSKSFSKKPLKPLEACAIEVTRYCKRKMDYDNFVASFKSAIDGLKDAMIIKDDNENVILKRKYIQEVNKQVGFKMVVVEL